MIAYKASLKRFKKPLATPCKKYHVKELLQRRYSTRHDDLYLKDILDASEAVERFIGKKSCHTFFDDEILQSAVIQKLIVIGEAAARTSKDFRKKHPEVEWEAVIAFRNIAVRNIAVRNIAVRNIAVHEYFAVNWEIVWNTAKEDVPELKKQIETLLKRERPPKDRPLSKKLLSARFFAERLRVAQMARFHNSYLHY